MNRRITAYLLLLIVSIIWGMASPVVKYTLQWFDPWIFLTYRFFISTLIALPYLWFARIKFPTKSTDIGLVLLTTLLSAPITLWLFFEALTKTTALSGSLFTAMGPLLLVAGGALFFHERISGNERWGISVIIIGALITTFGPFLLSGQSESLGNLEGNVLMFFAVIADMGAALFSTAAIKRGISGALLAHLQFVIGFILFIPLLLFRHPAGDTINIILRAPWYAHLGVLYMAVLSGTVAYSLRNISIKTIEVSKSAVFTYLQPLWAALLAVYWLKESVTTSYLFGGIFIIAGVVIAEIKHRTKQLRKRGRHR